MFKQSARNSFYCSRNSIAEENTLPTGINMLLIFHFSIKYYMQILLAIGGEGKYYCFKKKNIQKYRKKSESNLLLY